MNIFFSWTLYLSLRVETGRLRLWNDVLPTILIVAILALPFILLPGTDMFGEAGFLAKVSGLTSSLSGFYVAGLVAVAAFIAPNSGLDEAIEEGKVFLYENSDEKGEPRNKRFLTRRQYICYIFGYLSAICILLTVCYIGVSNISPGFYMLLGSFVADLSELKPVRTIFLLVSLTPLSHMIVTTSVGLFYLMDKMYAKKVELLPHGGVIDLAGAADSEGGGSAASQ